MGKWRVEQYGRAEFPCSIAKAKFEEPFVLISIADLGEGWEKHEIPQSPLLVESLELNFHEHSPLIRSHWKDERALRAHRCFSARDAHAILDLLSRRLNQVGEVVVVCEAGLFRSVVLADAIAILIGAERDDRMKQYDNFDDYCWMRRKLLWHAKRKRWRTPG
jgi:hypothetical protein